MLKNKKSKLFFIVLLLFLFMLGANFVLAFEFRAPEINYPQLPFPGVDSPQVFLEKIQKGEFSGEQALPLYAKYFYYLSLMIVGLLALGTMVYGGFLYLISAGAPVKMIAAKEQITGGILGLVILLSSYLILATINPQLAVFRLPGLEKVTLPEIEITPLEKKVLTYFQIPTGIIIENAVLNEKAQEKLYFAYLAAEEAAKAAEELYGLSKDIHSLVMNTDCGNSICSAGCSSTGCDGKDYQSQIETAIEKTPLAIAELEEKTNETSIAKIPLINDFSQLEAAGFLMSLKYWEAFSYNDLLSIKHYYEEAGEEVEVTSFPDWENIDIKIDSQIIKDPVTFYLDKEGNEDAIYLAATLPSSFYEQVDQFEPEEGWQPSPEGVPEVPLYKQNDPEWGGNNYGCGTTIAGTGCGPSSLAMVVSWYTGRRITPDVIAALSLKYGHRICDAGTAASLFSNTRILGPYGVRGSYSANSSMQGWEEILKKLNYGPVIISVGPSIFTGGGHYIVLKAKIGDIIYINDSWKNYYEVPEYIVRNAFRNGSGVYAWFK